MPSNGANRYYVQRHLAVDVDNFTKRLSVGVMGLPLIIKGLGGSGFLEYFRIK